MGERQEQIGLKVGVVLTTPTLKLHLELRGMLLDVFSASGHLPGSVEDGDRDALDADVLLIVGDCNISDGFAMLLSQREGRKPTSILWHLNPLPPLGLSEMTEKKGLRSSELWDLVKLPSGWFSKLTKSIIPVSARSNVRHAITWALFSGFTEDLSKDMPHRFQKIDINSFRNMMSRYKWIKRRTFEGCIDFVFASSVLQVEFLAMRGIPTGFAPVGYHQVLGENLGAKRDIDVLFIGTMNRRRGVLLNGLRRSLQSKGVTLVTVDGDCYGKERTNLLNRARISLNFVKNPWEHTGIRFLMSMGCGALVVSEPLYDPTPYKAGEHFVQASVADLPDAIVHYLENRAEREKIVQSAHDFVTRELTLKSTIKQIMEVCDADSTL